MIACFVLDKNSKRMDWKQNSKSSRDIVAYPYERQVITPPPPESSGKSRYNNPCNIFPLSPHTTPAFYHTSHISPPTIPLHSNRRVAVFDATSSYIFGDASDNRRQYSAICKYPTTNLCIPSRAKIIRRVKYDF